MDHHTVCFDAFDVPGWDLESLEAEEDLGESGVLCAHDLVVDGPHGAIGQEAGREDIIRGVASFKLHESLCPSSQAICWVPAGLDVVQMSGARSSG